MWIGLGSNLLVRDGGIRGAVIETHGVFDELERRGDNEIWCGSGVACAKLAKQCIKWGLGPAEFFAGIPGTLGGALAMNAGAFGGETWRHVLGVATIDRDGVRRERPASDYVASYRHVSGPADEWFLGARLTLRAAARREQRRHPPAARAPQGDAADRRMVVRLGVHESAGRSRGAPDRHRRPQGTSHRRRARLGDARELHRQRRHRERRGHRAADPARDGDGRSACTACSSSPRCASWEKDDEHADDAIRGTSAASRCCWAGLRPSARCR